MKGHKEVTGRRSVAIYKNVIPYDSMWVASINGDEAEFEDREHAESFVWTYLRMLDSKLMYNVLGAALKKE